MELESTSKEKRKNVVELKKINVVKGKKVKLGVTII